MVASRIQNDTVAIVVTQNLSMVAYGGMDCHHASPFAADQRHKNSEVGTFEYELGSGKFRLLFSLAQSLFVPYSREHSGVVV